MPTDAVWVIITIPKKEYEEQVNNYKVQSDKINYYENRRNSIESETELIKSFEEILSDTLEELLIEDVVWIPTRNANHVQVYFPCELNENDSILNLLKSKGIGTKPETSIGYIPFNLFFYEEFSDSEAEDTFDDNYENSLSAEINAKTPLKAFKEATHNFLKSITSRLTVAQVVEGVRSGAEITFDFCAYTLTAAFITAIGLIADDPVSIAASMMIEPVMGTVMAMTFGLVIHDKKLFLLGLKNNLISLMMCLIPGFIIGLIVFIWMTEWNPSPNGIWPTAQMQGRGTYQGIVHGVLIALPCGAAIAVSLLNSNYGALAGVAVASTFQPPFVNTGLLWAMSVHMEIRGLKQETVAYNISGQIYPMKPVWAPQDGYTPVYSYDMRIENALLGCVSLALTGVNIVCMLIVAYITLKIKEVMPFERMTPGTHRFFKRDLKIARKYNAQRYRQNNNEEPIGQQILKEWAEITGVDKNQLLSTTPEARVTQLQTLYDIAKDVESDETYKSVMGYTIGNSHIKQPGLIRRLTQPFINTEYDLDDQINERIWNTEQEMSNALKSRRFTLNLIENSKSLDELNDRTTDSLIGFVDGLTPSDLISEKERRRSSNQLKKSLKYSLRSPHSIWPRGQSRKYPDNYYKARQKNFGPHRKAKQMLSSAF